MITNVYASVHIDGVLDRGSLKVGVLDERPSHDAPPTPVVFFRVVTGLQRHPVWAIGSIAAKVYCYCQAAGEQEQDEIEVSLTGNLVSGDKAVCVVAANIVWHTSKLVRSLAETRISAMMASGCGPSWLDQWPSHEAIGMLTRA